LRRRTFNIGRELVLDDPPAMRVPAPDASPRAWISDISGNASASGTRQTFTTSYQGLTLVHFSAQLERFLWDRGCA